MPRYFLALSIVQIDFASFITPLSIISITFDNGYSSHSMISSSSGFCFLYFKSLARYRCDFSSQKPTDVYIYPNLNSIESAKSYIYFYRDDSDKMKKDDVTSKFKYTLPSVSG